MPFPHTIDDIPNFCKLELEWKKDYKPFELSIRQLIDSKYDRPPPTDNPFLRLLQGELPMEECRAVYLSLWDSLMVFNRVLLPRLLEKAPSVEVRVELMSVIAQEYGPRLEDAHPMLFHRFLSRMGVSRDEMVWDSDLENGPCKDEVKMMRSWSFCELVARILVGETLGPIAFPAIGDALKKSYNLSEHALAYFRIHAIADKKDTEILFGMIARAVQTDDDAKRVIAVIERSFDWGRYQMLGCKLPNTTDYRFVRRFDRRIYA